MKNFYIKHLNLNRKVENGYLQEYSRSFLSIDGEIWNIEGKRNYYSSAYYLLPYPNFNPLHCLKGDESWQYCAGNSIKIYVISPNGKKECHVVGPLIDKGEKIIHIVPKNHWMCAEVIGNNENDFTLISHFSFPGFDLKDHQPGRYEYLKEIFPQHEDFIKKYQWK